MSLPIGAGVKMADKETARDRELLTRELNKLNKSVIVDILVTKIIPSDLSSDLLNSFLTNLIFPGSNEEELCDSDNPGKESVNDFKCSELYVSMKSEIDTLKTLVQHLELRIRDQSEIISMLKSRDNSILTEKVNMKSRNYSSHTDVNKVDEIASVGKGRQYSDVSVNTHETHQTSILEGSQNVNNVNRDKQGVQRSSSVNGGNLDQDGFIQVKRKKRRGRIGTADVSTSLEPESRFEGSADPEKKKVWVFLKRVKDDTSPDKIQRYLTNVLKTNQKDVFVKKVDTYHKINDNNCFLVGVDPKYKQTIYNDDSLWPKGVIYQRFNFVRGQKFLDNQKYKVSEDSSRQQNLKPSSFLEIPNV